MRGNYIRKSRFEFEGQLLLGGEVEPVKGMMEAKTVMVDAGTLDGAAWLPGETTWSGVFAGTPGLCLGEGKPGQVLRLRLVDGREGDISVTDYGADSVHFQVDEELEKPK